MARLIQLVLGVSVSAVFTANCGDSKKTTSGDHMDAAADSTTEDAGVDSTSSGTSNQSDAASHSDGGGAQGDRLTERVYRAESGAESFVSLYDTELEQICSFRQTGEQGGEPVFHCINAISPSLAFLDDECTEPVAVMRPPSVVSLEPGEPVVTVQPQAPGCGGVTSYHAAGEPTTADALWAMDSGTCMPSDFYLGRDLYTLEPLDPSPYPEGKLVTTKIDADTGFEMLTIEGDGGSVFHRYQVSGENCSEHVLGDGRTACIPRAAQAGPGNHFADDACMEPLGDISPTVGCLQEPAPAPELAFYYELVDSCYRTTKLFEIDAKVEPTAVYSGDQACNESVIKENRDYYSLGSELSFDTVPVYSEVYEGTGRLQVVRYAMDGGDSFNNAGSFYDTELEKQCYAAMTGDDELRCLVSGPFVDEGFYFSDAGCSEPLFHIQTGGCNPQFVGDELYYERNFDSGPPVTTAVNELTAHEAAVYEGTPEACDLVDEITLEQRGHTVVALGADVPLSTFAPLELVVK